MHLKNSRQGKISPVLLLYGGILFSQLKCFLVELATLSEENQAELEKAQELVMAVEEQGPSPKALSGVMVW